MTESTVETHSLFSDLAGDLTLVGQLLQNPSAVSGGGVYLVPDKEDPGESQERYFSHDETPFYLYWSPDDSQIVHNRFTYDRAPDQLVVRNLASGTSR